MQKNNDPEKVSRSLKADSVTGKMMYLLSEKDWRLGNISGRKHGSTIEAKWTFMQEGMVDSIDVRFDIQGDKLTEQSSGATYEYMKTDCAKFPAYDFDFGM